MDNQADKTEEEQSVELPGAEEQASLWHRQINPQGHDRLARILILINFIFFFTGPQYLGGLEFVGAIRLPMIISLMAIGVWLFRLHRGWTTATKLLLFFLVFEGLRGIVGYYFDPANTIVRNEFKQFQTWKALVTQAGSITFPIAAYMAYRRGISLIFTISAVISGFLGAYALTHRGQGPGGFLGDENDLALVLVMFLPFCVLQYRIARRFLVKLVCVGSVFLTLAGTVATNSRGGFLGLVAVLVYLFIRSRNKIRTVFIALILGLCLVPLVPEDYWTEMYSIKTDVEGGTGTIQKRMDMWKVAFRIWTDPRNFIFGIGLENTPYYLADYENPDQPIVGRSFGGRTVHSLYFQLLPEIGLFGLLVVGGIMIGSIVADRRSLRQAIVYQGRLALLQRKLSETQAEQETSEDTPLATTGVEDKKPSESQYSKLLPAANEELVKAHDCFAALNVSWVGVLVAGIGISVLYYPPIWFLVGLSAAAQLQWYQVRRLLRMLSESLMSDES